MGWRRRGTGWPTPNPGASFSSDVSSKDYPGAEGDWFAYKLNDWIGGTPAEMMRRQYEYKQQQDKQRQQEIEEHMAAKKAKKAAKVGKGAAKKSTKAKKPTKAKQAWLDEQKKIMESAQQTANPTPAPASTTTSGVSSKAVGEAYPLDVFGRGSLLTESAAAAVPGTVLAQLHAHLKFAHEQLAEWEATYATDLAAETLKGVKKVEDEYKAAGATALREMHSMAFDAGVKKGIEEGQNSALDEIAKMFGGVVESTPEQSFAFLQAQVKLRDAQRDTRTDGASEVEKLKTRVLDAEEAKKVVAEQCKIAEKERELALKAAKAARDSEDEMRKARDAAVKQFKAADEKLVAFAAAGKNGAAKDDTSALVAAAEDQALVDIASMFGGTFTSSADAFAFLQTKAKNGHG